MIIKRKGEKICSYLNFSLFVLGTDRLDGKMFQLNWQHWFQPGSFSSKSLHQVCCCSFVFWCYFLFFVSVFFFFFFFYHGWVTFLCIVVWSTHLQLFNQKFNKIFQIQKTKGGGGLWANNRINELKYNMNVSFLCWDLSLDIIQSRSI